MNIYALAPLTVLVLVALWWVLADRLLRAYGSLFERLLDWSDNHSLRWRILARRTYSARLVKGLIKLAMTKWWVQVHYNHWRVPEEERMSNRFIRWFGIDPEMFGLEAQPYVELKLAQLAREVRFHVTKLDVLSTASEPDNRLDEAYVRVARAEYNLIAHQFEMARTTAGYFGYETKRSWYDYYLTAEMPTG